MRNVGDKPGPATAFNVAGKLEHKLGDVEAGFRAADVIVERSFKTKPVHQGYIEPHACLVSVNKTGQVTIWSSSQGHFVVRDMTAQLTGHKLSDIRAIPAEIGGGFGGKTIVYLEPLALILAKKSGRPVKMVMTREEVFRATGPTSGSSSTVKIGATRDGRITAVKAIYNLQAGAFPGSPIRGAVGCSLSPYDIANVQITGYDVVTNRPKVAAYRAPGAPIGAFSMESTLDELAKALKMDPLALRQKNAAKEGTKAAYGPTFGRIGYAETVQAALSHPHYKAPLGPNQGRGVASGFWFNAGGESSAQVYINEDGTAVVVTGHPDIGGSRASMVNIVAEMLGIDYRNVQALIGDTSSIGFSALTGGSRVTFAARARGQDLEDRCRGGGLGERRGPSCRLECRRVPAADAARAGRNGKRHRRPDQRALLAQHGRCGGRVRHAHLRCRDRSGDGQGADPALHGGAGCRSGHPSELRGGPDPGRRRARHRLGAQRGMHLRRRRQAR
jgi:CO/xanthine dehydrogenase Mo-binding subunit